MNRALVFVALLLIGLGILGFQAGAYSTFERLFLRSPTTGHPGGSSGSGSNHNSGSGSNTTNSNDFEVNTILNYGNGSITWFNDTKVPKQWNFYNLTVLLANGRIDAKNYIFVGIQEHQILAINGLAQNSTYYWSLWKFCPAYNAWDWANVGADEIALSNNGIYGWYYQSYNTQFAPVAGAATTEVLDIASC